MKQKLFDKNKITNNRLNNVIKNDKMANPKFIADVIKSDFFYLINNFFETDFNDIGISITVDESNKYNISISSSSFRLKVMKSLPDS